MYSLAAVAMAAPASPHLKTAIKRKSKTILVSPAAIIT